MASKSRNHAVMRNIRKQRELDGENNQNFPLPMSSHSSAQAAGAITSLGFNPYMKTSASNVIQIDDSGNLNHGNSSSSSRNNNHGNNNDVVHSSALIQHSIMGGGNVNKNNNGNIIHVENGNIIGSQIGFMNANRNSSKNRRPMSAKIVSATTNKPPNKSVLEIIQFKLILLYKINYFTKTHNINYFSTDLLDILLTSSGSNAGGISSSGASSENLYSNFQN